MQETAQGARVGLAPRTLPLRALASRSRNNTTGRTLISRTTALRESGRFAASDAALQF